MSNQANGIVFYRRDAENAEDTDGQQFKRTPGVFPHPLRLSSGAAKAVSLLELRLQLRRAQVLADVCQPLLQLRQ